MGMGSLWARLATYAVGKGAILYVWIGVAALIGAMYLRIAYLGNDRDKIGMQMEAQRVDLAIAHQTNTVNTVAIHELVSKLRLCGEKNLILEKNSQQAITTYRKALEKIRGQARDETQRVQQALQNETCAMVTIPSDVERVLRTGAARARRDS